MSLPRSVADALAEHVTLEVEGIDRLYLNVYIPQLQREPSVFRFHRGHQFAASALTDPISKTFVTALEEFARREKIVVQFRKGQPKDDIAAQHLHKFTKTEGVVFIRLRRKPRCSAPNGAATKRRAPPTHGWCAPPRW